MLLRLFLLVAITFSAAHACIDGASLDANGNCKCNDGLKGSGDLCCYNDDDSDGCFVAGDPVLTSYSGTAIGLDFPCGTLISSSTAAGQCVVNVVAASTEVKAGVFYTSSIKIQLRIQQNMILTINGQAQPPTISYERDLGTTIRTQTLVAGQQDLIGVTGSVVYNQELGLITVDVCQTKINYRAVNGNSAQQDRTPGICVLTRPGAWQRPGALESAMCRINQQFGGSSLNHYLDFATKPMINYIYNSGILKETTSSEFSGMCQSFQENMLKCNEVDKPYAVKKCAFLLFHPVVRRCLYSSDGGAAVGHSMRPFLGCLEAYCTGSNPTCDALKQNANIVSCAPNLLDCTYWPPYRRNNQVVVGEGGEEIIGQDQGAESGREPDEVTEWDPLKELENEGILGNNNGNNGFEDNAGGVEATFNPDILEF